MSDLSFTHLDPLGRARMVDVTPKEPTHRRAVARCKVLMKPETTVAIANREVKKGDVLSVARVAGIQAAAFWGTIMAVLSIIPGIGSALVWLPAAIILIAGGSSAITRRQGVDLDLPRASTIEPQDKTGLTINIQRDGTLTVGRQKTSRSGFPKAFADQLDRLVAQWDSA